MIDIASTTGWKLLSGSPMPIITTFEMGFGHLTVPSAERCSDRIAGARTSATALSFSRSDFARSVIASNSARPRWWIHWKTWRARNGFSPCCANHAVIAGNEKSRRFTRSLILRLAPRASRLSAVHLVRREEVRDLDGGRLGRIGAVHRVGV